MIIKILHQGTLEDKSFIRLIKNACRSLKIRPQIILSENIKEMLDNGVLVSPGLIINDKLIMQGRKPDLQKVQDILFYTKRKSDTKHSNKKQLA